jgi:hypothetical protein
VSSGPTISRVPEQPTVLHGDNWAQAVEQPALWLWSRPATGPSKLAAGYRRRSRLRLPALRGGRARPERLAIARRVVRCRGRWRSGSGGAPGAGARSGRRSAGKRAGAGGESRFAVAPAGKWGRNRRSPLDRASVSRLPSTLMRRPGVAMPRRRTSRRGAGSGPGFTERMQPAGCRAATALRGTPTRRYQPPRAGVRTAGNDRHASVGCCRHPQIRPPQRAHAQAPLGR